MAIKFAARALVSAAACLTLGGCDIGLILRGQPDYKFARSLSGVSPSPASPAAGGEDKVEYDCVTAPTTAADCYWQAKNVIDFQYQNYKTNLLHAVNNGTAFSDFTALALNTAGAITPGAAAAKLFNALSAGVNGTKTLVNQDVLYKQTITILMSEMDSDRSTVAKTNEANLAKSPGPSVAQTINGLLAYYEAGTFQHALVTLATKAGTETPTAQTAAASAQVVATIQPNVPGTSDCSGDTFSLAATIGGNPVTATYTAPAAAPVTPQAVATAFADLPSWAGTGATVKAGPTSSSVTIYYTSANTVTWAAGGSKTKCTMSVSVQTTASAK